eukprot:CAMPEP_0179999170 /NCGR_PEP_ID=MMETSP0984-20121128/9105_1 /TAXON_ID=483367 /ORGANISM="non described non described, Strain CCMP 2436" /LENGTH=227 /DNA_ID=CAMNT_0021918969 /DNA_START=240 /DNA_END=922 /DNA_ORIENTATION=+
MRTTSAARCRSSRRGAQAREGCKRASHAGDLSGPRRPFRTPATRMKASALAVTARRALDARPGGVPHASHTVQRRDKRRPGHARAWAQKARWSPPDPGLPGGEHTCSRASSAKGPARSAHVLDLLARADCVRALDRPQAPVRARAWQDREGPVQCVRAAGVSAPASAHQSRGTDRRFSELCAPAALMADRLGAASARQRPSRDSESGKKTAAMDSEVFVLGILGIGG